MHPELEGREPITILKRGRGVILIEKVRFETQRS